MTRLELSQHIKRGMRLRRTARPNSSFNMNIGSIYTVIGVKDGWIKLKEHQFDGHAWHPQNFEVL